MNPVFGKDINVTVAPDHGRIKWNETCFIWGKGESALKRGKADESALLKERM
jgi:hypothetical protein